MMRPAYKAFTLVEVLVVVAIIAMLCAMLLPTLNLARRQGDRIRCAGNLRTFGHALLVYASDLGRFPDLSDRSGVRLPAGATRTMLDSIGDVAEAVVARSLGRPEPMFCPTSLERDPLAPRPFLPASTGTLMPVWRQGKISYIYLNGVSSRFEDAGKQPTYWPEFESPDRRLNRRKNRTVLAGDRVVDILPARGSYARSNHDRQGGWFLYTTGDAVWSNLGQLTPHPTKIYNWYWPRMARESLPVTGG